MDATTFRTWIDRAARVIAENRDRLTQLDTAIGDGDHGTNLVRGFQAAGSALEETAPETPGAVLGTVGAALISKVGGASGPLFGTAFRRAGKALGTEREVSTDQLGAALAAALEGVTGLGAAAEGDKTMVDALAPAVRAYQQAAAAGGGTLDATRSAATAAQAGADATIPMQARKGRASYLGPRSVGHQDPGAASTALLLAALADTLDDRGEDRGA